MNGSLMSPFHPTVVRGFSKYTRISSSIVGCNAIGQRAQAIGVLPRGIEVVDGAGPNDDEQAGIAAIEDGADGRSAAKDRLLRLLRQGQRRLTSSGVGRRSLATTLRL